jgi:hypothetical protein
VLTSVSAVTYYIDEDNTYSESNGETYDVYTPASNVIQTNTGSYYDYEYDPSYEIQWRHHQRMRWYSDRYYDYDDCDYEREGSTRCDYRYDYHRYNNYYDSYDGRKYFTRYNDLYYPISSADRYDNPYRYYDRYDSGNYYRSGASYYKNKFLGSGHLYDYYNYKKYNKCSKKCDEKWDAYKDSYVTVCEQTCKGPYYY